MRTPLALLAFGLTTLGSFSALQALPALHPQGSVESATITDPRPQAAAPRQPLPSERLNLAGTAEALRFEVPSVSLERLYAEDALDARGPDRIGVERPLNLTARELSDCWFETKEGELFACTFDAPEAIGLRLRFEELDLPPGAQLWIYSAQADGRVQGPITGRGPSGNGTLWSADMYGPATRVECFVPAGAPRPRFTIPAAQYIYKEPYEPTELDQLLGAGACHNDVMCFATWHPLHNATVRLTFVDGGTYLCSATLVSTTSNDQTPYLLTANHCVATDAVAATVAARFFYQTVACNGATSSFVEVDHCDVVATNSAVDITLMILDGALPSGVTWAGWSTATNNNGTAVRAIHHPAGARKKYSEGSLITHPFGDATRYYGINWTSGTIEGGTSGSAVWRNSNQLVIGVASHTEVPGDCTNPDGPSGYGKFPWFYSNVAGVNTLFAGGSDDAAEPNDTCTAAVTLAAGTYTNRIVKRSDEDWYTLAIAPCKRLELTLTTTQTFGDVDIELRNACGGTLLASDTSANGTKTLTWVNTTGASVSAKLRVFMGANDADTRAFYDLSYALPDDSLCGCPTPSNFCIGALNSNGSAGTMSWSGSPRVALNSFVLRSSFLPANKTCLYFYGPNQVAPVTFGNGYRCIGSPIYRLPTTSSDFFGDAFFNLNLNTLPPGGGISAGSVMKFQCWYRDPAAGGAAYNSTDGLSVTFCP
ncbi:MAG: hypothetical protein RL277_1073 [Planctomycetota bacterium]|jgi:hypothetical protein